MNKRSLIYLLIGVLLTIGIGCKSSNTLSTGTSNLGLSAKQLIKENSRKAPNFKTLSSRVKINVNQNNQSKGYTVNLRMEKDKQILLMSSPITIVKALITPERVSFYNKLDNTYFDGDFTYLSDLLGTELDYQKVQNLLLGEALFNLNDKNYEVSIHQDSYLLQPKNQLDIFELFYILNPSHYKLDSQQLAQPKEARLLQIDYLKYQEVEKQTLPEFTKIIALEADEEMIIELEYKSVALNEALRFPYRIPSGYEEIELK